MCLILGTEPGLTWGPPRAPGFGRAPGKYDTCTCQHHFCTLRAGDAPGPCRPIPPAFPPTLMPAAQAVALASWVLAVPDSVRRDGFGSCCVKRGSTCSPSQSQTGEGGGDVDQLWKLPQIPLYQGCAHPQRPVSRQHLCILIWLPKILPCNYFQRLKWDPQIHTIKTKIVILN